MKFFQINALELHEWPKTNTANTSGDLNRSEGEMGASMEITSDAGGTSVLGAKMHLPAGMAFARSLLDEVKDPLGINDSLYQ